MTLVSLRLKGGIGNQLFQQIYAAHVAKSVNASIHLDTISYIFDSSRWSIPALYPNAYCNYFLAILLRAICMASRFVPFSFSIDYLSDLTIDDNFARSSDPQLIVVNGYFQRFCTDNELIRLSDVYRVHSFMVSRCSQLSLSAIPSRQSLAVHVRRGDYLNPSASMIVLNIDYYLSAIEVYTKRFAIDAILFYGEDSEWISANLLPLFPDSRHIHLSSPLSDMLAISMSRYHVISNSTFSWWSSVLSRRNNDEVYILAPSLWSVDPSVNAMSPGSLDYIDGISFIEP